MKKICSVFVVALLAVMLCVPTFAADRCQHNLMPHPEDNPTCYCAECDMEWPHDFGSSETCHFCGAKKPYDFNCEHLKDSSGGNFVMFYDEDNKHFAYCLDCAVLTPFDLVTGYETFHSDPCSLCGGAALPISVLPIFTCPQFSVMNEGVFPSPDFVSFYYDDADHYLYCSECGASLSYLFAFGETALHSDDCYACNELSNNGYAFFDPNSTPAQGILPAVSSIVTSAVEWLTAFALCIVSNPLLLVFVVCVFVGLGIGLVKRTIRL